MPAPDPSPLPDGAPMQTADATPAPAAVVPAPVAPDPSAPAVPQPPDPSLTAPAPNNLFEAVLANVAYQVQTTVKPAAAAAVATTFGFPLVLTLAVILYLAFQSRIDNRDPKLRYAPSSAGETFVAFQEEDR